MSETLLAESNVIPFEHHQSAHCENGVVSNLLRHHGIVLSEAMVFGIGSGLFFSYMPFLKLNGIPVTSFRPMPGMIFSRITARLGIKVKKQSFGDPDASMKALNENLAKGIPTGMLVGVFHLTYFPPAYRFHFNAHNLVVFGKEEGKYQISDPVMETYNELDYNELKRVRYAKGLAAPNGKMYYITGVKDKNVDIRPAIVKGIRQTCDHMLNIPIPFFGVKGMHYQANRMVNWPKKLGEKKAALYLGQVVRMLEEIGTGGAGFRFIYAAFLQEAAEVLQQSWLHEVSKEMTEVGDMWREFSVMAARICKDRSKASISYADVAALLHKIADREKLIYQKLFKISLNG